MTVEGCLLWQKARVLAQDRGFQLDAVCPMEAPCTGSHCVFLNRPEAEKQKAVEELRKKLEKGTSDPPNT